MPKTKCRTLSHPQFFDQLSSPKCRKKYGYPYFFKFPAILQITARLNSDKPYSILLDPSVTIVPSFIIRHHKDMTPSYSFFACDSIWRKETAASPDQMFHISVQACLTEKQFKFGFNINLTL